MTRRDSPTNVPGFTPEDVPEARMTFAYSGSRRVRGPRIRFITSTLRWVRLNRINVHNHLGSRMSLRVADIPLFKINKYGEFCRMACFPLPAMLCITVPGVDQGVNGKIPELIDDPNEQQIGGPINGNA